MKMIKNKILFLLFLVSILVIAGCQDTVGRNPTNTKCSDYTGSYGQAACGQDKNCEWDNKLNKCVEILTTESAPAPRETYTKDEVDLLLSKLNSEIRYGEGSITYNMLARLNKCTIIKDNQQSGVISCNEVCNKAVKESVCVLGEYSGTITSCSDSTGSINTDRFCKCCGL